MIHPVPSRRARWAWARRARRLDRDPRQAALEDATSLLARALLDGPAAERVAARAVAHGVTPAAMWRFGRRHGGTLLALALTGDLVEAGLRGHVEAGTVPPAGSWGTLPV